MGLLQRLRKLFQGDREIAALDEAQSLAFLEALVMTAHIDGEVTEEEQRQLQAELATLPFAWAREPAAIEAKVEAIRLRLIADRHLSTDEMARHVAETLTDGAARRKLLTAAVALAHADGIDELERTFLGSLARAFDVSEPDLERIVAVVKSGVTQSS